MTYNELSKFQVIDGPLQIVPNNCAGCSRYQNEDGTQLKFIDWNLELEFHGKVYLCESCVREMAEQFDMHSESEFTIIDLKLNQRTFQLNECMQELEKYKNAVASLDSIGISIPRLSGTSVVAGAATENGELPYSEPVREHEESESKSDESNDVGGSSDVSTDESDDTGSEIGEEFFTELDI